jgi:hypothetical protein
VDQRENALVVNWCFLQTYPSPDFLFGNADLEGASSVCSTAVARYSPATRCLNTWHWEVLPITSLVLIWHHRTSTCSPNWRSASKLMKTSKRKSGDGYVCRKHHFTTKALTLNYGYDKSLNRFAYI